MIHIYFRSKHLLNKSILVNTTIKRYGSGQPLPFGDIQTDHIEHSRLSYFVSSYFRTTERSTALNDSFSIDLHDKKLFSYKDILNFGNLFHHDNNLPIDVTVARNSILRDRLDHKLSDNKFTLTKKELFFHGLNALQLAFLNTRAKKNLLDSAKSIEDIEKEYNVDVKQMFLKKILQRLNFLPEDIVLVTYRKHLLELKDVKTSKQYKDMELVVALYGYIAMMTSKNDFVAITEILVRRIKID